MGKLFAGEDFEVEAKPLEQLIEAKIENSDIPDIVEFHEDAIQVAVEGVSKAANELYIIQEVKASLESKKLSSVEYFTSVENYSLYMKSVANNLGIKSKIPSMEDFKNPYGVETSHRIAMEGFSEFIRSVWEKIKSFFKDFFKRIMLFFKRLTNANLQMEEYEMYIEDLMHNVKKSDKSSVEQIKVDSKLPALLATSDVEVMKTDYLLTKGKQKMDNLTQFTEKLYGDIDKGLMKDFERNLNGLKNGLTSKAIQAADIDNIRHSFVEMFRKIFTIHIDYRALPDEVQSDVMSMFSTAELNASNFYSFIPDRNTDATLPKNFNIYHVSADVEIDQTNRTSKLFICSNTERNNITENKLETISSRENLLRLYDFYKKFSKEIKIEKMGRQLQDLDKQIEDAFKVIKNTFSVALETVDSSKYENATSLVVKDATEVDTDEARALVDDLEFSPVNRTASASASGPAPVEDGKKHIFSKEIREKLNDLSKFLTNLMNVIQVLLKEMSVGLLGTYQEVRYEMIKYLYKCAKQF